MATCTQEKYDCVKWVEKYFRDCVCDISSEVSFGLGIVSLLCWGIAEIPQIITNFQTKSGHGVSLALLLTWVLGDVFNLVGCILEPVTLPTQLYTALLYTATTLVLVFQTIYYDYRNRRKNKQSFDDPGKESTDEKKPLDPKRDVSDTLAKPIFTSGARMDMRYMSARSMANSGSSPYSGVSYLRTSKSGPPNIATALHYCSSEDDGDDTKNQKFNKTTAITIPTCTGYGTFLISAVGLPSQAKAMALYAQSTLQQQTGPNHFGMVLGWIMAAIYMGGRLPQIYLNIQRGNVEGLNPLMFIFALVANATYVGSILARSIEWYMIKANAPWLLDAAVCVLLDLLIIVQFVYYKLRQRKVHVHSYGGEDSWYSEKIFI